MCKDQPSVADPPWLVTQILLQLCSRFLPLALKRTKQTLHQRVVNAVESNICVAHLRGKVQIDKV